MLILLSHMGIPDWNDSTAREFVLAESRIPTGATARLAHKTAMITFARIPEEQGLWSGDQVRQILAGLPISAIPMTRNTRSTIIVNPRLLDRIGARLPASFLDTVFLTDGNGIQ